MKGIIFWGLLLVIVCVAPAASQTVVIGAAHTSLVFKVGKDGRVRQCYYGKALDGQGVEAVQLTELDAFPAYGKAYVNEPALRVTHADGNLTTELVYSGVETAAAGKGIEITRIRLKDSYYDFSVTLCFKAYTDSDVIEQWTEFVHGEKKAVTVFDFASSQLAVRDGSYWLTSFYGNWAAEMNMKEQQLSEGTMVLDSRLGVRTNQFAHACFLIGLDGPAKEDHGTVIGGTLAWPGSWRMAFEVDPLKNLHILSGINPFASQYTLKPKEVLKTPALLYTISTEGKGAITRRFHNWARQYGIHAGSAPRMTLLNNWEATYFDFNEKVLKQIIGDAADMGFDLFLLDDGWFGTKFPVTTIPQASVIGMLTSTSCRTVWTRLSARLSAGISNSVYG